MFASWELGPLSSPAFSWEKEQGELGSLLLVESGYLLLIL